MSFPCQLRFRILLLALSQVMGGVVLAGQSALVESPARPVNAQVATNDLHRKMAPAPPEMPVPPAIKSPVAFFRELLAMSPSERSVALSNRPPENRKLILAKIREYRSLSENERELRLRATELEWYLVPLMKTPATNRAARLTTVPEEYRKMIQSRLDEWDKLAEATKKELVDNRDSICLYIQMTSGFGVPTNSVVPRRAVVE